MIRPAAADVFSATFARLRTVDSSCDWKAPRLALSLATVSSAASIVVIAVRAVLEPSVMDAEPISDPAPAAAREASSYVVKVLLRPMHQADGTYGIAMGGMEVPADQRGDQRGDVLLLLGAEGAAAEYIEWVTSQVCVCECERSALHHSICLCARLLAGPHLCRRAVPWP